MTGDDEGGGDDDNDEEHATVTENDYESNYNNGDNINHYHIQQTQITTATRTMIW